MSQNRPEQHCASSFPDLKGREKNFVKRLRGKVDLPLYFISVLFFRKADLAGRDRYFNLEWPFSYKKLSPILFHQTIGGYFVFSK